jgi:hypothetical protein
LITTLDLILFCRNVRVATLAAKALTVVQALFGRHDVRVDAHHGSASGRAACCPLYEKKIQLELDRLASAAGR